MELQSKFKTGTRYTRLQVEEASVKSFVEWIKIYFHFDGTRTVVIGSNDLCFRLRTQLPMQSCKK